MPRIDHRIDPTTALAPRERMVFDVLLAQINALRTQLSLPVLTQQTIRQAVRQYMHDHPDTREDR